MKIFKFGGASIKDAKAIGNIIRILKNNDDKLLLVISAIDKTTNELETLLNLKLNKLDFEKQFDKIKKFHLKIASKLFSNTSLITEKITNIFNQLAINLNKIQMNDYHKSYDSIVHFGEILSTTIIAAFLQEKGLNTKWLDARKILITDDNFTKANINFDLSLYKIKQAISDDYQIFIIQGFIGGTKSGTPTTLGREGSDYSAAVFANLLNAKNVTLWKDVQGIYNADPKLVANAVKLKKISFSEATELAYFGAKIIHPKTTKPLIDKNIPLHIKSFSSPETEGTIVGNFNEKIYPQVPVFIFNKNQTLITLTTRKLNFISEFMFHKIFSIFHNNKTKINLIQNSALTISLCFDHSDLNFEKLLQDLSEFFSVRYNKNLTLITIRHYTEEAVKNTLKDKRIFMQQQNRLNAFFLVDDRNEN